MFYFWNIRYPYYSARSCYHLVTKISYHLNKNTIFLYKKKKNTGTACCVPVPFPYHYFLLCTRTVPVPYLFLLWSLHLWQRYPSVRMSGSLVTLYWSRSIKWLNQHLDGSIHINVDVPGWKSRDSLNVFTIIIQEEGPMPGSGLYNYPSIYESHRHWWYRRQ